MNNLYIVIAAVIVLVILALVILGAVIGVMTNRGKRSTEQLQEKFGPEYDRTVETLGDEKKAKTELLERQKHVEELNIQPLSMDQRERYLADWGTVQSKFVDEPKQAIVDADRLIMEVMQMRAYPVSNFEQRAADISVNYPSLVSNYREARVIALKNEHEQANTEELRRAMILYRSLFEELLVTDAVVV